MRWRVTRGDWVVGHIPGSENPSDIGTKALSSETFEKFKQKIGMGLVIGEVEEESGMLHVEQLRYQESEGEDEKLRYQIE